MPEPIRFERRPKPPRPFDQLSLGDILQRLAAIAPDDVAALDVLARAALLKYESPVLRAV